MKSFPFTFIILICRYHRKNDADTMDICRFHLLYQLPTNEENALCNLHFPCTVVWVVDVTRAMNHDCCLNGMQLWISFCIWYFGRNDQIIMIWLNVVEHPKQNVSMWQTTLLPFNRVHPTMKYTKLFCLTMLSMGTVIFCLNTCAMISCRSLYCVLLATNS